MAHANVGISWRDNKELCNNYALTNSLWNGKLSEQIASESKSLSHRLHELKSCVSRTGSKESEACNRGKV